MIIGITGHKQAGKDTVGLMIQQYIASIKSSPIKILYPDFIDWITTITEEQRNNFSGWTIKKFASPVKEIASIILNCDSKDFESSEFKNSLLPSNWITKDNQSATYRWALQQIGTNLFRNNFHPNTWVNILMNEYDNSLYGSIKGYETTPNWIITDVRFLNEAAAIKERRGIIIQKLEGSRDITDNHPSETELEQIIPDATIPWMRNLSELYTFVQKTVKGLNYLS